MKLTRYKTAVPALVLVVLIAGSMLVYDILADKNNRLPGERDTAGDSASEREDMAAPLLNQFQLDGRHYILLSDDLKQEYGLPAETGDRDIGGRIATITTSVDPSLIGSDVYSYNPAGGEAILAVKKDDAYQLFRFFTFESYNNNQDEDSDAYLKLYGISKAEDIGKVQFIGHSEQSKLEGRTDIRGEITDPGETAQFYGYYSVLKNSADKYFDTLFNYKPADYGKNNFETDGATMVTAVPPDAPDSPDSAGLDQAGSGSTQPSQGTAGNALSNMVTIRIYNQNGIYYDSPYYRNIGFLSRYEVSQPFAAFMESYIE